MGMKANSGFFKGTIGSTYNDNSEPSTKYIDRKIEVPDNIKKWMSLLKHKDDFIIGKIDDFSIKDVSILSKETGVEYAKISMNSKTYLIKGNKISTDIPEKIIKEMKINNGTFDFHSHPFDNDSIPSISDRKLLHKLSKITGQKSSKIVTPNGKVSTFNEFGIISIDTVKNDINENLKNAYLELFGGNNDK